VRIFLAEKGMSLPLVTVDLAKGEQHAEAYRAITIRVASCRLSSWRMARRSARSWPSGAT
jgi:hypothetical protein